jgi:hypothetical protein
MTNADPFPISFISSDEGEDLPFGPVPSRLDKDRELIAKDVADELRVLGGEVINVVSHPDGVLITGFTKSNALCYLLICHSSKPPRPLPTSIYVVRCLSQLRNHLQLL